MVEDNPKTSANLSIRQLLQHWFKTYLGSQLLELERNKYDQVLPDLFGYHILQIGCLAEVRFLDSSRIAHKIILRLEDEECIQQTMDLISTAESIPVDSDSMDVVVVPHVLEFTGNPHKLLRETERILIEDGYIILLGFNPWSLWGLWRLFLAWREIPPWCGHFYGLNRIKDWLSLLDFEVLRTERFFFRPPLHKKKIMQKLEFLEKLGKYCWPYFGGAYLIVAKKRVIPLSPIKMHWSDRRTVVPSGLAEPTARIEINERPY